MKLMFRNIGNLLFAAAALLTPTAVMTATPVTGGNTTVALNSATVNALVGLGFSIGPIAPGTLTGLTAVFPITGGDTTTDITHSGGLAFTDNGITSDIESFVINFGTDTLTGTLIAGGKTTTGVTFFDLESGGALTLDAQLAGDLVSVYGIPNLAGASIGTATVNATLAPEPSSFSLGVLGALVVGCFTRRLWAGLITRQARSNPTANVL